MRFSENIKITVEYPTGTFREVKPLFSDIRTGYEREGDEWRRFIYRLRYDGRLKFIDDVSKSLTDFSFLKAIEEADFCATPSIMVEAFGETVFSGYLELAKGDYDKFLCQCEIPLQSTDDAACLVDSLKDNVNILQGVPKTQLQTFIGNTDEQICADFNVDISGGFPIIDNCIDPSEGWVLFKNEVSGINLGGGGGASTADIVSTTWIRLKVSSATQPIGTGWIDIGGGEWAKSPLVVEDEENSVQFIPTQNNINIDAYKLAVPEEPFRNAVAFQSVLERLLSESGCGLTVVSNFFGINADGLNVPSNAAYSETKQQSLFVYQKTDIKRPTASQAATVGYLNLEELFETLYVKFCAFPAVEGNTLRLEHVSYFRQLSGTSIDLTQSQHDRWVRDKQKYEYQTEGVPKNVNWYWQDHDSSSADFRGLPVSYEARCSNPDANKDLRLTRFTNDILGIYNAPDNFTDDGFCMVAGVEFNGVNHIDYENSALSGDELANGFMSFPNLQNKFWRHWAWLPSGEMNGQTVNFDGVRPLRKLEKVTVPGFCPSDFVGLDPSGVLRHPCGNAEIDEIYFSVKRGKYEIQPIF